MHRRFTELEEIRIPLGDEGGQVLLGLGARLARLHLAQMSKHRLDALDHRGEQILGCPHIDRNRRPVERSYPRVVEIRSHPLPTSEERRGVLAADEQSITIAQQIARIGKTYCYSGFGCQRKLGFELIPETVQSCAIALLPEIGSFCIAGDLHGLHPIDVDVYVYDRIRLFVICRPARNQATRNLINVTTEHEDLILDIGQSAGCSRPTGEPAIAPNMWHRPQRSCNAILSRHTWEQESWTLVNITAMHARPVGPCARGCTPCPRRGSAPPDYSAACRCHVMKVACFIARCYVPLRRKLPCRNPGSP